MSEKMTKLVVDLNTGVTEEIELTAEEITQIEADRLAYEEAEAARVAAEEAKASLKASAKAKLIAGEPLTAEEVDALVI